MNKLILCTALLCQTTFAVPTIELNRRNTIVLEHDITLSSADTFMFALLAKRSLLPIEQTLYIIVASPGGEYGPALAMKQAMLTLPNAAMICKYCASAAGMLFATFTGQRLATEQSIVLMHEMYVDHITVSKYLRHNWVELKKDSDAFDKLMYTELKMSKDDYAKRIRDTIWVLQGQEVVDWHLANKLVKVKCDNYVTQMAPATCGAE